VENEREKRGNLRDGEAWYVEPPWNLRDGEAWYVEPPWNLRDGEAWNLREPPGNLRGTSGNLRDGEAWYEVDYGESARLKAKGVRWP
jgi:hypothetical protein